MSILELSRFLDDAGIAYRRDEPLSGHCTFAVGGPASLFISPSGEKQVTDVIEAANRYSVKFFVLGNGSNVLFSDAGFSGAVLHVHDGFTDIRLLGEDTIECGSGASIKALTEFALENGLTGLEFAYGIPGSTGGGVYMNAGAYGGEMRDALTSTFHISKDGKPGSFTGEEMGLGYRRSAYTGGNYVITKARFKLSKGDRDEIRAKMDDYMSRRRDKQPLDVPSAGSTFKRPEGGYASELIDRCGLKGRRAGGAMVSEKHAGFVVNAGGATCGDILDLIAIIQREVKQKTGIELHPEVKVIEP